MRILQFAMPLRRHLDSFCIARFFHDSPSHLPCLSLYSTAGSLLLTGGIPQGGGLLLTHAIPRLTACPSPAVVGKRGISSSRGDPLSAPSR